MYSSVFILKISSQQVSILYNFRNHFESSVFLVYFTMSCILKKVLITYSFYLSLTINAHFVPNTVLRQHRLFILSIYNHKNLRWDIIYKENNRVSVSSSQNVLKWAFLAKKTLQWPIDVCWPSCSIKRAWIPYMWLQVLPAIVCIPIP